MAARLASIGFEANAAALEGHKGFFQAYGPTFDAKRIRGRLGSPFSILDPGSSVKPYPCGVVGQVVMDSMRDLLIMNPFRPEDVRRIRVTTSSKILPPAGPLKYRKAEIALQGKFCVPFQMAAIVIRHKAGMMEFTDEFVKSPEVQDMMERVETAVDPSFDCKVLAGRVAHKGVGSGQDKLGSEDRHPSISGLRRGLRAHDDARRSENE